MGVGGAEDTGLCDREVVAVEDAWFKGARSLVSMRGGRVSLSATFAAASVSIAPKGCQGYLSLLCGCVFGRCKVATSCTVTSKGRVFGSRGETTQTLGSRYQTPNLNRRSKTKFPSQNLPLRQLRTHSLQTTGRLRLTCRCCWGRCIVVQSLPELVPADQLSAGGLWGNPRQRLAWNDCSLAFIV